MLDVALISLIIVNVYPCTLSSIIGQCLFGASFISDIEISLRELNDEFFGAGGINGNFRKQLEIRKKFIEIIQFHSNTTE